jgi:hypothetical protein
MRRRGNAGYADPVDVYDYFHDKEREFADLGLTPDRAYDDLFAEEAGSNGLRGRIFGNLRLDCEADAFLAVSEVVVVKGSWCDREEYGYFFILVGAEMWGYERDLSHNPPVHMHTYGHRESVEAAEISFKRVAELAWTEVSRL